MTWWAVLLLCGLSSAVAVLIYVVIRQSRAGDRAADKIEEISREEHEKRLNEIDEKYREKVEEWNRKFGS